MKKKLLLLGLCVLAFALIGLGISYAVYRSPGTHMWLGRVSINLDVPCYVYDPAADAFLADSQISWHLEDSLRQEGIVSRLGTDYVTGDPALSIAAAPAPASINGRQATQTLNLLSYAHRSQVPSWYGLVISAESYFAPGTDGTSTPQTGLGPSYCVGYIPSTGELILKFAVDGQVRIAFAGFESQEAAKAFLTTPLGKQVLETVLPSMADTQE